MQFNLITQSSTVCVSGQKEAISQIPLHSKSTDSSVSTVARLTLLYPEFAPIFPTLFMSKKSSLPIHSIYTFG